MQTSSKRLTLLLSSKLAPPPPRIPRSPQFTPGRNAVGENPGLRLWLAHMHDAGHERMQRAVVGEVAFARKRTLELVAGIHSFGREALVLAGDGMRRFIAIDP